jgi:hypothetical protein
VTAVSVAEVSDDHCAVVASEGGKVKSWRVNSKFDSCFWIEPGTLGD